MDKEDGGGNRDWWKRKGEVVMYYLNTSTSFILFQKTLNNGIYVDKSVLIQKVSQKIGTEDSFICITRPRRFGKSVNAHMLGAYYTRGMDSHALFDSLAIAETERYPQHLNQHNVIFMDLSRMPDPCESYKDYIDYIKEGLTEDIEEGYGLQKKKRMSLSDLLTAVGEPFIFILDEWDAIFHKEFMTEDDKRDYLEFLKGLLKNQPYVELAYLTGVLPITKYSSGSELNMFDEYSFMNDNIYDSYFGFSEMEVRELCQGDNTLSYEELKAWYDGYRTSEGQSLFNPRSVSQALSRGVCQSYWAQTGPMNEIADCIANNVDEVREDMVRLVAGIPVEAKINGYSVAERTLDTREKILSAMVVYGFLSYYQGVLRIPNRELMEKFESVLANDNMGEVKAIVDQSKEMLRATLNRDESKVAAILENVHDREIPFLSYGDENALSCVITLCYLAARDHYDMEREAKSGKGYCDYLFLPKKKGSPAIILELKVGGSCEEAIAQIKVKDYLQKARAQGCRDILLVGINYDKNKRHQCRIEEITHYPC